MKIKCLLIAALLVAAGCSKGVGDSLPKVSPEKMGMDSHKLCRVDSVINKAVSEGCCKKRLRRALQRMLSRRVPAGAVYRVVLRVKIVPSQLHARLPV